MPVDTSRCANCGIELEGSLPGASRDEERDRPDERARGEQRYCCDGCAEGGPCTC